MTTDFSLMDVMGNFTGMSSPVAPDEVTTATSQVVAGPEAEAKRGFVNPKFALKNAPAVPSEDATYGRMLQAESNNKDFDAQGRPITSPKGAMFASQVMPATAAAPGYGIKPAASQTPEEYNRVGREYYQALLKQFGGNEQAAAAAYNAGPTRVQQNLAANQGQLNVAQLPKETQGYLGKIFKGVGSVVEGMIPSAQAGTLPQRAVAPQAAPAQAAPQAAPVAPETRTAINPETGETYQQLVTAPEPAAAPAMATTATTEAAVVPEAYTGQGLKFGGQTAAQMQQQQDQDAILNSDSKEQLSKLAFSLDTPKDVQKAALDRLHNSMAVQQGFDKAQKVLANLGTSPDPRALNRAMNDRDTGSYFKVLMYQALGWTSKAKEELEKINPKTVYGQTSLDGVNYRTKFNPNTNEILAAWDADGTPVDQKVLTRMGAEGINPKAMGNVKEVVRVGDKTIGVYQDGSMVDLGTRQRYTGSLAGAEKLVGTGIEGGETGLVDPTTNIGGYSRAYENGKLVVRDAANKIVTDPGIASRIIKTGVGGETPAQKAMNKRVEAALEQLAKDYAVPTEAQKIDALRKRAIPDAVIEEKLGLTPGSLTPGKAPTGAAQPTGPAPAAPVSPAQAAQPVPQVATTPARAAPARTTPVATGIGPKPQQPEFRPQNPGESNNAYKDYKKAVQDSYESELDVWKKKQDRMEKKAEELPRIEQNAQETIATVEDLINHPGFSDVIGMPNIITGIYSPPTTDARDFKSKYKQILGQQFLSAYDKLRGGGQISNTEGAAAQEAIAAMRDPYISEKEFKRNAKIFTDTVKRGINRQRAELGLDPAYADVPEPNQSSKTNKPAAGAQQAPQTPQPRGQEGQTATSKSGKPIIFRNGRWEYQ